MSDILGQKTRTEKKNTSENEHFTGKYFCASLVFRVKCRE